MLPEISLLARIRFYISRRNKMREKLYTLTKPIIVSARISDDEMESVARLMEMTDMTASQLMRRAFRLMVERFNETGQLHSAP